MMNQTGSTMRFDEELFDYVVGAAREFENGLDDRAVVPSVEDIKAIDAFDEPLPKAGTAALDVIKSLHETGAPATTLSRSGRFFGFVVGKDARAIKRVPAFFDCPGNQRILSAGARIKLGNNPQINCLYVAWRLRSRVQRCDVRVFGQSSQKTKAQRHQ